MERSKWIDWYKGYLKSKEWRTKKMEALFLARYKCRDCGADYEEVHHLTYARVGYERMSDLVVLCRRCHEKRHKKN